MAQFEIDTFAKSHDHMSNFWNSCFDALMSSSQRREKEKAESRRRFQVGSSSKIGVVLPKVLMEMISMCVRYNPTTATASLTLAFLTLALTWIGLQIFSSICTRFQCLLTPLFAFCCYTTDPFWTFFTLHLFVSFSTPSLSLLVSPNARSSSWNQS